MKNYFNHKMRGKSPAMIVGMVVLGVIGIAALAILFGFVLMWLWNWLMPELFDLPTLTYWQAIGLFILSKILLGGIGGGGSGSSKHKKSSDSCDSSEKKRKKGDFSKWEHYDKFWKEKGETEYAAYVESVNNPSSKDSESDVSNNENESDKSGTVETE